MLSDLIVELASPAMVGGAENKCDAPPTLRPPSIRGQLRFWARAIGSKELEERIWGNIETGQRVKIIGAQPLKDPRSAYLLPHNKEGYNAVSPMVPPGERVLIRFAIPNPEVVPLLQANLWAWLHLGAIGKRSRRGYGSLLWEPHPSHILEGFLDKPFFDRWTDLQDPATLAVYLKRGIERTFEVLQVPLESKRQSQPEFSLRSLDQVFIGKRIDREWHVVRSVQMGPDINDHLDSPEYLLHGLKKGDRGSAINSLQLGNLSSKPPSPMMWRVFPMPTGKEGYVPVMIWSPLNYPPGVYPVVDRNESGDMPKYLESLGFCHSLSGNSLLS